VSNHDTFRELIEGYALGSLDAQDRATLDAHLTSGCSECAQALQEANWLVSQLAYLAPSAEPSEMLRGRLLRTVRVEAGENSDSEKMPAEKTAPWWMWAGVAALLMLTAYLAWTAGKLNDDIAQIKKQSDAAVARNAELQNELAAAKRDARILTDPQSKKIMLPSKDKGMPELEVMWHPQLGICLMGQRVPMPKQKRVFQLWLIPKAKDGKPMPMHTLWPDADGKVWHVIENPPEAMWNTKALAVTEEPAGGSPQPTSEPMWVGALT
jgi:anti-sigma-K factor RskA